ncbi:hypothetical protein B0H34DRAFT_856603 [Crassisporium funariophilum]|nr:hypothetical protein B0H34DRAFT_856603 [Crassisporium funariophilum]
MTLSFFSSKQEVRAAATPSVPPAPMPNVFVVPPEEDETPTWCFFDAAEPALSQIVERPETPDIDIDMFSFPPDSDTPPFRRVSPGSAHPVIMPRRSNEQQSVVDALINNEDVMYQDDDTDSEYEQDLELEEPTTLVQAQSRSEPPRTTNRNVADDSDVIEVVKVRRNRRASEEESAEQQSVAPSVEMKRSNTIKSRASKAFRSLTGSLRSSKSRSKTSISSGPSSRSSSQHQLEAPESPMSGTFPQAPAPSISRRGSRVLSQLFVAPSLKTRTSISSFDEPTPIPSSSHIEFAAPSSASRRSSLYEDAAIQDQARLQAASPAPTTSSFKTKNRRFSMLNLQKLFSFSSSTPAPTAVSSVQSPPSPVAFDDANCDTPTFRSLSSTPPSAPSSMGTTSGPQTPTSADGEFPVCQVVLEEKTSPRTTYSGFDSMFDTNAGLNLGLGLGIGLDSTPSVSSQEQTPRRNDRASSSFSSRSFDMITPKQRNKAKGLSHPLPAHERDVFTDEPGDESLEMKLDSFHFKDLSFDADKFFSAK